jgi:carbonic anhydrase
MSVFDSASNWPDSYKACGAPHQSPVNLSQSIAVPCDRLCELNIDDVVISDATVMNSSRLGGIFLNFTGAKPTIRFNGKGYTAVNLIMTNPSQHTIENVRAEAECMIIFEHPSEPNVILSLLVRTSPGDTPSNQFFNAFVPYPSDLDEPVKVTLGNSWQIQNLIPESKGYFIYEGTTPWPECDPNVTWIIFNTAVSIDPSDFAKMRSKGKGGYRPLQEIGDRQVYFNDGEKVSNSFSKKDGKKIGRAHV